MEVGLVNYLIKTSSLNCCVCIWCIIVLKFEDFVEEEQICFSHKETGEEKRSDRKANTFTSHLISHSVFII